MKKLIMECNKRSEEIMEGGNKVYVTEFRSPRGSEVGVDLTLYNEDSLITG